MAARFFSTILPFLLFISVNSTAQTPSYGGEDISWWAEHSTDPRVGKCVTVDYPLISTVYETLPEINASIELSDPIGYDAGGGVRGYNAIGNIELLRNLGSDFIAFSYSSAGNGYEDPNGPSAYFLPNYFPEQTRLSFFVQAFTYPPFAPAQPATFHFVSALEHGVRVAGLFEVRAY